MFSHASGMVHSRVFIFVFVTTLDSLGLAWEN